MPRITDKSFVYTPSFDTDLKKKFRMIIERERRFERERKRAEKSDKPAQASVSTVVPIGSHSAGTHSQQERF
jgi:hypothetical protein